LRAKRLLLAPSRASRPYRSRAPRAPTCACAMRGA